MKHPTYEKMAKNVAEQALDSFLYDGKSIREWMQIIASEDAISRAYIEPIVEELENICINGDEHILSLLSNIKNAPSVTPQQKTGRWIERAQYSDGKHKIECSECGHHIFDRGHANSFNVKHKYKYCPSCGAKMEEVKEK